MFKKALEAWARAHGPSWDWPNKIIVSITHDDDYDYTFGYSGPGHFSIYVDGEGAYLWSREVGTDEYNEFFRQLCSY